MRKMILGALLAIFATRNENCQIWTNSGLLVLQERDRLAADAARPLATAGMTQWE